MTPFSRTTFSFAAILSCPFVSVRIPPSSMLISRQMHLSIFSVPHGIVSSLRVLFAHFLVSLPLLPLAQTASLRLPPLHLLLSRVPNMTSFVVLVVVFTAISPRPLLVGPHTTLLVVLVTLRPVFPLVAHLKSSPSRRLLVPFPRQSLLLRL